MKLKTILDNKNNFVSSTGGTWRIISAPTFPYTLTVNSVSQSYLQNDVIAVGSDNPDVQWTSGQVVFSYTIGDLGCQSVATLSINNISRVVTINNTQSTVTVPFSISPVTDSQGTSLASVNLTNVSKTLNTAEIKWNMLINGVTNSGATTQLQYYKEVFINKADLPAGSSILNVRLKNQLGGTTVYVFVNNSNTSSSTWSPTFINELQNAFSMSAVESALNITYNTTLKNNLGALANVSVNGNNQLVLKIPIFFLPSSVTTAQWHLDVDHSNLLIKNNGSPIPYTSVFVQNTYQDKITYNVPGISCPIACNRTLTVSNYVGDMFGTGVMSFTNSSTITPAVCITNNLSLSITPTCNSGVYEWKDSAGTVVSTTSTYSTSISDTYTVSVNCSDCIDCINTVPYVKSITI